jgi:heptosyltransferase-2
MSNKILIVGPAWVGDMVMAQSLFKLIKQRQPDAVIDVLAPAWSQPILARMPEVANGIVMPIGHGILNLGERYRIGMSLREEKYAQAIVLPNSFKSALIPFFAKIPKRTGWSRELRGLLLNDLRRLDKKRYPLMVQRYMALALPRKEKLTSQRVLPELFSSLATQGAMLTKYQLAKPSRPVLAVCPGAEFGPSKRWPEEKYAAVANAKLAEGWDVWILGSAKDTPVAEKIMQLTGNKCVNLAGRTNLVDAVDLLSLATKVITNDSGLMHIAAAVNKPLLALYGPTSTLFTPPLNEHAQILQLKLPCQPCFKRECPLTHHKCMQDLPADKVLQMLSED